MFTHALTSWQTLGRTLMYTRFEARISPWQHIEHLCKGTKMRGSMLVQKKAEKYTWENVMLICTYSTSQWESIYINWLQFFIIRRVALTSKHSVVLLDHFIGLAQQIYTLGFQTRMHFEKSNRPWHFQGFSFRHWVTKRSNIYSTCWIARWS